MRTFVKSTVTSAATVNQQSGPLRKQRFTSSRSKGHVFIFDGWLAVAIITIDNVEKRSCYWRVLLKRATRIENCELSEVEPFLARIEERPYSCSNKWEGGGGFNI